MIWDQCISQTPNNNDNNNNNDNVKDLVNKSESRKVNTTLFPDEEEELESGNEMDDLNKISKEDEENSIKYFIIIIFYFIVIEIFR